MSPILVRPVREQLEHDRVIRLLHGKSRRRHDAGMNPGMERNVGVGSGTASIYPDIVLFTLGTKRVEAVVEVETGESVNHLEALAEWAHYAKLRAAFHLYVPAAMVDVARRLCDDNHINVTEIWSYHSVGDDVRFTLIHKSKDVPVLEPIPVVRPASVAKAAKPKAAPAPAPVKKAAVSAPAKRKAATPKAPAKRVAAPKRAPAGRAAKAAPPARRKAPAAKKVARPAKRK